MLDIATQSRGNSGTDLLREAVSTGISQSSADVVDPLRAMAEQPLTSPAGNFSPLDNNLGTHPNKQQWVQAADFHPQQAQHGQLPASALHQAQQQHQHTMSELEMAHSNVNVVHPMQRVLSHEAVHTLDHGQWNAASPHAASEPSSARSSRPTSPTDGLLTLSADSLIQAVQEAARHGQPKPTKATIRVPARAVRLLLRSKAVLEQFQASTNVTFVTCCSETHPNDGVAEILVRGTRDAVQHATAMLEHLGKVVVPRLDASLRPVPSVLVDDDDSVFGSYFESNPYASGRQSLSAPMSPAAPRAQRTSGSVSVPQSPMMSSRSSSMANMLRQPPPGDKQAFVFIDNSNIFIGAQLDGNVRDLAVRVNIRTLCEVVEGGLPCHYRAVTGTAPSSSRIWHEWENNQYRVFLSGRQGGSDDALHHTIAEQLRQHADKPQILVLATGDGNETERFGSFPQLAEEALQAGWDVRVWSWEQSISGKFRDLMARYADQITISFLDPFKQSITFKAGQSPTSSPQTRRRMSMGDEGGYSPRSARASLQFNGNNGQMNWRSAPRTASNPQLLSPLSHGQPHPRRGRHSFDLGALRQDLPSFPHPGMQGPPQQQQHRGGRGWPQSGPTTPGNQGAWGGHMAALPENDGQQSAPAASYGNSIW
eukprot:TRINITY_DN11913_c0_g1_i1.p1 TRINITY_DN11913_c0_g1~~TRINITY_DN11913_c0_g1_i1.p1  ORF type:complete len:652 (+),score=160.16 TRINITY_DN11913_c0_g1_i1:1247-3202(+)